MKNLQKILAVSVIDKNGIAQSKAKVVAQSLVDSAQKWILLFDEADCCFGTHEMPQGLYKVNVKIQGRPTITFKVRITSKPIIEQVIIGEKDEVMIWYGGRQIPVKVDGSSFAVGFIRQEHSAKRSKSAEKNLVNKKEFEEKEFPGAQGIKIFAQKGRKSKKTIRAQFQKLETEKSVAFIKPVVELPNERHGILSKEIFIHIVPGTDVERLAAKFKDFDLRKTSLSSHFPNIYQLVYKNAPDLELIKIVSELDLMSEIERAELFLFTGGNISTQIFPGDVLRPGQYYLTQMGVPEAWQILTNAGLQTYGNADIINAVDDTGIGTTMMGATITHPDFNTLVVGGNLSAQVPIAVPNSKVYYSIDYRQNTAIPHIIQSNNDAIVPVPPPPPPPPPPIVADNHGTETAGIILAAQNGGTGIVGIAANTRLLSVISPIRTIVSGTAFVADGSSLIDYRMHFFGFDSNWNLGGATAYPLGMASPVPFNVPGLEVVHNANSTILARSGPGASIVNQSYKTTNLAIAGVSGSYIIAGRKGRQRKGMISIGTAANDDAPYRLSTLFGPDNYSLIISASTIDHLQREIVAGYSCFAIDFSPGIDCCAPSSNIGGTFNASANVGVITTTRVGNGNITGSFALTVALTAITPVGGVAINASTVGLPGAGVNSLALLQRAGNNNISEWVVITGLAPGVYTIQSGVRHQYIVGDQLTLFNIASGANPNSFSFIFGGTSASAPMVAGVISLMLTANPNLTRMDVKQIIRTTSIPININHRGPRPANITTGATYNDTAGALISNTDLNWIQFAPGAFGTLAGSRSLLLATGLLDTNGNPSIVSPGLPTYPPNNHSYPQWFINVGVLPGAGPNFQARQAILIGAETILLNNVPDPVTGAPQNFIDVVNAVGMAVGNTLRIGRYVETTLDFTSSVAPFVGRTLDVVSTDGFQIGDTIDIVLTGGIVSRRITGFGANGILVPAGSILAGGKTRIILDPTQPTVTIPQADAGAIVRSRSPQETNLVYLHGGAPPYVGRDLNVVSVNNFQVGETIDIFLGGGSVQRVITGFTGATQINLDPAGLTIAVNPADAGVIVRSRGMTETATITAIAPVAGGQRITINNGTPGNNIRHAYIVANNIPIRLSQTEIRAVKAVTTNGAGQTILEVDRLEFQHAGPVRVTPGLIADYSFQFGYGRIDAPAAIRAALNYHANNHPDVMIRDNMADVGTAATPVANIQSEDIWVRNANDMLANPVAPANPGPHQMPALEFQITNYAGTANHNDIIVTGDYTGAALGTYVVSLDGAGNFSWTLNGGAATVVAIAAGTTQLMDAGISLIFNTTAYDGTEVWTITAQPQTRFIYVRATNRGAAPTFTPFPLTGGGTPPDFYLVRAFLQLTDGSPVPRFDGAGLDDLEVTGQFGGLGHSKFEIQIDGTGAPDTYSWRLDGGGLNGGVAITGAPQLLSNGVSIRFRATTGHTLNDYWLLKARPAAERFKTLDDYILANAATRPYNIRSGRAGTKMLQGRDAVGMLFPELEIDQSIDGPAPAAAALTAGANRLYAYPWPEADMPMVRAAFAPRPVNPLRMFLLAEILPHDGALSGTTISANNNLSYRELIVARFGYLDNGGANFANFVEVDGLGTVKNKTLVIDFVADVISMPTESLKVHFEMELANNNFEVKIFEFTTGAWQFTGGAPAWATGTSPTIGTSAIAANGDQHQVRMTFTLAVSNLHVRLKVEPKIHSAVQPTIVLAEDVKLIPIYTQSLLPSQRYTGGAKADLAPRSHFFTEPTKIVQTLAEAYGPVDGDKANRFRVTSLFKRVGSNDPKAYAPVDAFVVVQRDPANTEVVNVVLKPFRQPMLGFTPIKYFIYRGIKLTDYLKGTSATDEKLVRAQAGSNAFVTRLWDTHTVLNPGLDFEMKAFGYDPDNQVTTDLIDDIYFRQDPSFQLPKANKGEHIGEFYTNGGADIFGFEIILEEGEFQPDLGYIRKASHEVDVTGMLSGTPVQQFAIRQKREEILNYMDPAAFYGLHRSDKGQIKAFDNGVESTYTPDQMFTNIIEHFHTKNTLYIDIRNENGQSYNFYRQYDDASGNSINYGNSNPTLAAKVYETDSWPLIISQRLSTASIGNTDLILLQLRKDYNANPILYIEHGSTVNVATKGRFIANTELGNDPTRTDILNFTFPNHDLGGGNKIGTAWLLKLHYGLQIDAANSPFPNEVPPTENYKDNLFGPLSLKLNWKGTFNFAWHAAQDKKFIDASNLGFSQVVNRGLAIEDKEPTTDRILFYANAKDAFINTNTAFVPYKGLTGGVSKRDNFFEEKLLIDGYLLNYDVMQDGADEIKSLSLAPSTIYPRPLEAMLMLGLGKDEYNDLVSLAGFNTIYPRNVQLEEIVGSPFTVNTKTYRKFKVGVRGLNNSGLHHTAFPATVFHVYSIDDLFFFSKKFSELQPLPTVYTRNYEEALGLAKRVPRNYIIKSVNVATKTITIQGKDLRYEIITGDKVVIKTSTHNDGEYDVSAVNWTGTDTEIVVTQAIPSDADTLGDLHEIEKKYEDFFIAKDIQGDLAGTQQMSSIVSAFEDAVTVATVDAAGLVAITTAVNTFAPQIWNRAKELSNANNFEYADDRILYWARIKMLVALKSHEQVLKSITERNRLTKLFEDKSRGIEGFAITGGTKKVVLAGVDPFYLGKNIMYHNPAGAAALAMSGRTFTINGQTFKVEVVILPARYRDLERNGAEGLVEEVFRKCVDSSAAGYQAVDLVLGLWRNGERKFTLNRFAARNRGGISDNENRPSPPKNPTFQIANSLAGKQFYETSLDITKIVPVTNPDTHGFDVIFDNAFEYTWTDTTGNKQTSAFPEIANADGQAKAEDAAHPNNGLLTGTVPTALTSTSTPKDSDIRSINGSASNYLGNEIFYRLLRMKPEADDSVKIGLISLPKIQDDFGEFVPTDTKNVIDALLQEIANVLTP